MPGWTKLDSLAIKDRLEAPVQGLFNHWADRPVRVAGAPGWLRSVRAENRSTAVPAFGYSFTPDVLWEHGGAQYVLELKCAKKNEPLALAEVLHHAHVLETLGHVTGPVRPVLVTMYSGWLRAAVAWFRQHGGTGLQLLEMDLLQDSQIVWLDDPHAPWAASAAPSFLPDAYRSGWNWFHVAETNTWIATRTASGDRPVIFTEPYVMVAPLFLGNEPTGEHVLWQGTPPKAHSSSSPESWKDAEFFLHSPTGGEAREPRPPR